MPGASHDGELNAVAARYALRQRNGSAERYSWLKPDVCLSAFTRERAMLRLFSGIGLTDLSRVSVLEIGCGGGGNLLRFLQWGFDPARLTGNELLPERLDIARSRLPERIRLIGGDASELDCGMFDIVYQSTVLSSILDEALQAKLARRMWEMTKPDGGVLWYDFRYDNPRNPDVRGVSLRRLRDLFPESKPIVRRVTLAPPISRAIGRFAPSLYPIFHAMPMLRTHLLCWIPKRSAGSMIGQRALQAEEAPFHE
jgi:SAM-dependent methyltransferase